MSRLVVLARVNLLFLVAAVAAGCGGGTGQKPAFKVSGKVTFEGKPMAGGGSISFMPMSKENARGAGGTINEDGTYTVTTYQEGDGAVAGEYRVLITQVTVKEPENKGDESPIAAATFTVAEEDRIPAIYGDPNSPLTTKVEEKENQLDFDLKRSAGPAGRPQGGA